MSLLGQFLLPWLMSADWKYDGGDHNFDRLAAGAGAVNQHKPQVVIQGNLHHFSKALEVHGEQLQGMVLEYNRVSTPQISLEKVQKEWVDHVANL